MGCRLWGRTKLDTTSDLAVSAAAGEINQEKRGYATNFPPKQTHEICHNNVGRFHLTFSINVRIIIILTLQIGKLRHRKVNLLA